MTQNRRSKRATRERMAQTGEKYTEARRALLASGGDGDDRGQAPDTTFAQDPNPLGWFTDQAYNLILLADDEARMLSHPTVEPEHLLLATTRRGNAARLLGGNPGPSLYAAIEQIKEIGAKLEMRPRRSAASEEVLGRAVTAAAARGILGPSTEHLLIAVAEQSLPARLLAGIGVPDAEALVDAKYPVTRPPIHPAIVQRRAAQLSEIGRTPPNPGPIAPIFERFTSHARDAVNTGIADAHKLNAPYVEPVHLLSAALQADGIVASARARLNWDAPPTLDAQPPYPGPTDICSDHARRIVAEDVLVIAERIGHRSLTTGHLLIALLESQDKRTAEIANSLPEIDAITAAIIDALAHTNET